MKSSNFVEVKVYKSINMIRKFLLSLLILFLFVSIVIIFRSFLMHYIIEPVALLIWLVWRIISSVDQNIYWIVLIVFCVIIFLRLIPPGNEKSHISAYNYTYEAFSRVEHWQRLIWDSALGRIESEYLRDGLKELLIAVSAQNERSDTPDSEEVIAKGKVSLSPAARRYLFPSSGENRVSSINSQRNSLFFVPRQLRRWGRKFVHQDHTLIDEILSQMETELEINYEE